MLVFQLVKSCVPCFFFFSFLEVDFSMYFQIVLLKPAKVAKISARLPHSKANSALYLLLVLPLQASQLSWQLALLATLYPGSIFSS